MTPINSSKNKLKTLIATYFVSLTVSKKKKLDHSFQLMDDSIRSKLCILNLKKLHTSINVN